MGSLSFPVTQSNWTYRSFVLESFCAEMEKSVFIIHDSFVTLSDDVSPFKIQALASLSFV